MEWIRTETLAMASAKCPLCEATGLRVQDTTQEVVACNCILRAVFRECYNRFAECNYSRIEDARCSLENSQSKESPGNWSRKNEEYCADFLLLAKRHLTEEEHKIFRFRYLLGADWRLCARKLNMEKGIFHHTCYRIQQKLGRAFAETRPCSLYPVNEYFTLGYRSREPAKLTMVRLAAAAPQKKKVDVPVKRAA
ncbi:MAG: hypothetical protein H7039_13010 [Bryobacteraceae bacterium]|nr:hypothetical protein [Bryobacteraceae bacterium]